MKKTPVISANGLSIGYPKTKGRSTSKLYDDISFDLYSGELTSLLGANGAGKSTLLRTLTGLQSPLRGEVLLNGRKVDSYSEQEISMLIGLVLTDKTASGGLTVSELVGLGRYPYTGFFGRLSQQDHAIIEKSMSDVCILHKRDCYLAELSDGERQKVMIAKALAQECPIIILDEPTAFLDVVNRIEITNLLHNLAITQNKTILLSTHDIELALSLSDRLWLMAKDKGLECGVTEDIIFSDSINSFIGNSTIQFSRNTGSFVSMLKAEKEINLQAEGELYFWMKNFLHRNHFSIIEDEKARLTINVNSPSDILLITDGQTQHVSSFAELNSLLRQL